MPYSKELIEDLKKKAQLLRRDVIISIGVASRARWWFLFIGGNCSLPLFP